MIALPWWLPFGRVPEIEARALAQRLEDDAEIQLVDVRTVVEHERSRIANSINAPITELRRRLDELPLRPELFTVAICLSAHRSVPAVRLLRGRGFTDVVQLAGGMLAWWAAELPAEGKG